MPIPMAVLGQGRRVSQKVVPGGERKILSLNVTEGDKSCQFFISHMSYMSRSYLYSFFASFIHSHLYGRYANMVGAQC